MTHDGVPFIQDTRLPVKSFEKTSVPYRRVPEVVLSRIWNDGWHSRELRTVDGRRVGIVYRGVWTHSNGPDFRDAMLELDGRLIRGSVELHINASDWVRHGHAHDPAYDDVILHVVLENDARVHASGPSGAPIPVVVLGPYLKGPIEGFPAWDLPADLGALGKRACLPTLAGERPDDVRTVLRREGWRRLHGKQLRFQQEMIARTPGEVLYRALLDSLGLTGNRRGMAAVADALPVVVVERIAATHGVMGVQAALLGVAGFMPLSPGHASLISPDAVDLARLDQRWTELRSAYRLDVIDSKLWNLNRVRPLNHPARRLASLSSLLGSVGASGLLGHLIATMVDGVKAFDGWLASVEPQIGTSRRRQMIVNAIAPFLAAYAEVTGDDSLSETVAAAWERLPGAVDDAVARQTLRQIVGDRRFRVRGGLEVQGLHRIGREGCAHLRCFECPIAELAVRHEGQVTSR